MLDIGETHQRHEDKHKPHPERHARKHRRIEPHLPSPRTPPQPKQAHHKQRPAHKRQRQPTILFTPRPAFSRTHTLPQICIPRKEHRQRTQCAQPDRQETQPLHAQGQPVEIDVDDGKRLEGHVEDGVAQREVGARRGDDGLEEEHAQGPREHAGRKLVEVEFLALVLGDDVEVRVLLAQSTCAADEKDGGVGFGEEGDGEQRGGGPEERDPEGPAPADGGAGEASDDRGEEGAEDGRLDGTHQLVLWFFFLGGGGTLSGRKWK